MLSTSSTSSSDFDADEVHGSKLRRALLGMKAQHHKATRNEAHRLHPNALLRDTDEPEEVYATIIGDDYTSAKSLNGVLCRDEEGYMYDSDDLASSWHNPDAGISFK